jgi:hypothetical protein
MCRSTAAVFCAYTCVGALLQYSVHMCRSTASVLRLYTYVRELFHYSVLYMCRRTASVFVIHRGTASSFCILRRRTASVFCTHLLGAMLQDVREMFHYFMGITIILYSVM